MQLSKRMQMIADMVSPSVCAADIGTDHAYIPIYLMKNHITDSVIASDVRTGPLSRAQEHILAEGLSGKIQLRMGDGLKTLSAGEADSIIIAGMGGLLMIRLLEESPEIIAGARELILQPQSDIDQVRRFLHKIGLAIYDEDMTIDDGKYYAVMKCVHGADQSYQEEDYLYGRILIEKKHTILAQYLHKQIRKFQEIFDHLSEQDTIKSQHRRQEIAKQIDTARAALQRIEGGRQT